jgi:hypothetical protein
MIGLRIAGARLNSGWQHIYIKKILREIEVEKRERSGSLKGPMRSAEQQWQQFLPPNPN